MKTIKKRRKSKKLSPEEKIKRKRQRNQKKEVISFMINAGFCRVNNMSDRQIEFNGQRSDIDDVFIYKNLIVITEYTISNKNHVSAHLTNKVPLYIDIKSNSIDFIEQLSKISSDFKNECDKIIKAYGDGSFLLAILYVTEFDPSDTAIAKTHGAVSILNASMQKYFARMASAIKRSMMYEILEYLNVDMSLLGGGAYTPKNISSSSYPAVFLQNLFSYLPSDIKIAAFYVSPDDLLKTARVMRYNSGPGKHLYQRLVDRTKINEIRKFLAQDGFFPNNIIVSAKNSQGVVVETSVQGNGKPIDITLNFIPNSISIIDGQHRLFAYHEGNDKYEKDIAIKRIQHVLLVVALVFPENIEEDAKVQFEARIFREINSKQKKVDNFLIQCIEILSDPLSSTAIAHNILDRLNENTLSDMVAASPEDKVNKIQRVTIVKYGLHSLLSIGSSDKDSLYRYYLNMRKLANVLPTDEGYPKFVEGYKDFCFSLLNQFFSALRQEAENAGFTWAVDRKDPHSILNVTMVNSVVHCLRNFVVDKRDFPSIEKLPDAVRGIFKLDFKKYKSSQYSKLGKAMYDHIVSNLESHK